MLIRNSAALSYGANKIMIKPAAGGRGRRLKIQQLPESRAREKQEFVTFFCARGATFSFRFFRSSRGNESIDRRTQSA
jgi:hypothetical protein